VSSDKDGQAKVPVDGRWVQVLVDTDKSRHAATQEHSTGTAAIDLYGQQDARKLFGH
jgi:hypothetical protein